MDGEFSLIHPPIEYGSVFDPDAELKNVLKIPTAERDPGFEDYKIKFAYQQEGLIRAKDALLRKIRDNSGISAEELSSALAFFANRYGFTAKQQAELFSAVLRYESSHRAIQESLKDFVVQRNGRPAINEKQFFKAAFGTVPTGEIEMLAGPMKLYVRCHKSNDFEAAVKTGNVLEDAALTKAKSANMAEIKKCLIPGLDGAVILENFEATLKTADAKKYKNGGELLEQVRAESREKFLIEEGNSIQNLFEEKTDAEFADHAHIVDIGNDTIMKQALRVYFLDRMPLMLARAKDEILSFMSYDSDSSAENIEKRLSWLQGEFKEKSPLDYRTDQLIFYANKLIKILGEKKRALIESVAKEVYDREYEQILTRALEAFEGLLDGNYSAVSIKKARAMLFSLPISRWFVEVKKLTSGGS